MRGLRQLTLILAIFSFLPTNIVLASKEKAQEYFQQGLLYFKEADFEAALKEFKRAAREDLRWAEAYFYAGRCEHLLGEIKKARSEYRKSFALNREQTDAVYWLAVAYETSTAPSLWKQAIPWSITADQGGVRFGRGSKVDEAIPLWRKLVDIDPKYGKELALALLMTGKTANAADTLAIYANSGGTLEEATRYFDEYGHFYQLFFDAYLQKKRWEEAIQLARIWREHQPDQPEFAVSIDSEIGYVYVQMRDETSARTIYEEMIDRLKSQPDFVWGQLNSDFFEHFGGSYEPPELLEHEAPSYTDEGIKRRVQGVVIIHGVIEVDGRVNQIKLLRGLGYGLDERAIERAKQWSFKPARLNNEPIRHGTTIEVLFKL